MRKTSQRTVIERWHFLKESARLHAELPYSYGRTMDLHDAAVKYVNAIQLVARRGRTS